MRVGYLKDLNQMRNQLQLGKKDWTRANVQPFLDVKLFDSTMGLDKSVQDILNTELKTLQLKYEGQL